MRPGIIIENKFELDIEIQRTALNRLMYNSIIKTKQINSFDKRRFVKLIGICEDNIFNILQKNISEYLS